MRNVGSVALCWAQALVIIGGAAAIGRWWAYLAAIVLMGPTFARFAIAAHEAAHKLLFTNKRANDVVGRWLLAPAPMPVTRDEPSPVSRRVGLTALAVWVYRRDTARV